MIFVIALWDSFLKNNNFHSQEEARSRHVDFACPIVKSKSNPSLAAAASDPLPGQAAAPAAAAAVQQVVHVAGEWLFLTNEDYNNCSLGCDNAIMVGMIREITGCFGGPKGHVAGDPSFFIVLTLQDDNTVGVGWPMDGIHITMMWLQML